MDTPSATDDGEHSQPNLYRFLIFSLTALLLISSCKQRETIKEKPFIDSTLIRRQQQHIADSLAKAAKPKKKIYITFDDGPNKGTVHVLQAVKEENIPVSFFIVGKHVFDSPTQKSFWEQLKADSAIELCNHSYTHALNHYTKFYQQPDSVLLDFEKSQQKLSFSNNIVRMPGRNAWRIDTIEVTDIWESKPAIDSVRNAGFAVMGWDIEWNFDHKTLAPDSSTNLLLRRIYNMLDAGTTRTPGHLVLLAHDQAFQKEAYLDSLHSFIQQLKKEPDYEFVVASKYPGVKK